MFNFLHKKYPKDEIAIIINIASNEIISAVVEFKTDLLPRVVYSHKKPISIHHGGVLNLPLMISALKESCEEVLYRGCAHDFLKTKRNQTYSTYVFVSSLWHQEQIVTKTITREEPFLLTQAVIDSESEKLFDEIATNSGVHIEKKIISLKANGYTIDNPVGRKVSSIDLKGFVATMDQVIFEEIRKTVYLFFPNFTLHINTTTLSLYTIATSYIDTPDFLLCIPEAYATQVLYIKDRTIESMTAIGFGKESLISNLLDELSIQKAEALSLLTLWKDGTLSKEKTESIQTVINNTKEKWHLLLKGVFANLSKTTLLPQGIFFADNSLVSHLLGSWITSEVYSNQVLTVDSFVVSFFNHNDLAKYLDTALVAKETIPTILASSILFTRHI